MWDLISLPAKWLLLYGLKSPKNLCLSHSAIILTRVLSKFHDILSNGFQFIVLKVTVPLIFLDSDTANCGNRKLKNWLDAKNPNSNSEIIPSLFPLLFWRPRSSHHRNGYKILDFSYCKALLYSYRGIICWRI